MQYQPLDADTSRPSRKADWFAKSIEDVRLQRLALQRKLEETGEGSKPEVTEVEQLLRNLDLRIATLEAQAKHLPAMIGRQDARRVLCREIMAAVSQASGLSRHALESPRRDRHIVRARHIFMYLCRKYTCKSLPEIGRLAGGREHTTALYGIRKVGGQLKQYASEIAAVETLLGLSDGANAKGSQDGSE